MFRNCSFLALCMALIGLAVPGAASAGGACTDVNPCGNVGGKSYAEIGPSIIEAPRGFYSQFSHQLDQAAAVCAFSENNSGIWSYEQTGAYYTLVNKFNASRARLNVKLARKHLGFAPALSDWTSIARFKARDGSTTLLVCPVG
jgi:hypothetical protein